MLVGLTRPEPAWRYLERHGVVEEGWEVVELRAWHEVWTFLGAWPTCRYVCFDPPPPATAESVALAAANPSGAATRPPGPRHAR